MDMTMEITLIINQHKIQMTLEEAKKLKRALDELFGTNFIYQLPAEWPKTPEKWSDQWTITCDSEPNKDKIKDRTLSVLSTGP